MPVALLQLLFTELHFLLFSINLFICVKLGKGDTRAASLLHELGLENRMIEKTFISKFSVD